MDQEITFNPKPTQEMLEGIFIAGGFGVIVYGAFHPYGPDSFEILIFFGLFFLAISLLFWIPAILTNQITLRNKKIFFRYQSSPWKLRSVKIDTVSEADIYRTKYGMGIAFKTKSGTAFNKSIKAWDDDLISHFFSLLLKIDSNIKISPEKYSELSKNFDKPELYIQKKTEYNKSESTRLKLVLAMALFFAVAITYINFAKTGDYSWQGFARAFADTLEGFLY